MQKNWDLQAVRNCHSRASGAGGSRPAAWRWKRQLRHSCGGSTDNKQTNAHPRLQQHLGQQVALMAAAGAAAAAVTPGKNLNLQHTRTPGCSSVWASRLAPRLVSLRLKFQPKTPPPPRYRVPVTAGQAWQGTQGTTHREWVRASSAFYCGTTHQVHAHVHCSSPAHSIRQARGALCHPLNNVAFHQLRFTSTASA